MAKFRILCKTIEVGPSQYLATVAAIEPDEQSDQAVRAETRMFRTQELATSECQQMAARMKARLIAQGHSVSSVDAV